MQVSADAALRQVAPAQEISDKLSGLVAGQKVMAEIQSLLPNGTYRALINQRNITLALPFSAKSGDTLELQVTENDGKLALAVVSRQDGGGEASQSAAASTTATLSRTGQLISTLFSTAQNAEGGPAAAPLNANQPISAAPAQAQDLAPLLKQALTQSGMFYESHQAEWVEGRLTTSALLQEPQGKLSSPSAFNIAPADEQSATLALKAPATAAEQAVRAPAGGERATEASASPRAAAEALQSGSVDASKAGAAHQPEQVVIAPQMQGLVAQQLEALATQNFSWQGQVWPGQEMHWEIEEDTPRRRQGDDETAANWSTRLRLILPKLGEIDAQIRLQGNQISLAMHADDADTRALLRTASAALRGQLDEAGLTLAAIGVDAVREDTTDGQEGQ